MKFNKWFIKNRIGKKNGVIAWSIICMIPIIGQLMLFITLLDYRIYKQEEWRR